MQILALAQTIYFFLPAYFANMAPVFLKNFNFLNYPLDFGKSWRGKRFFGENKTLRGFLGGIIFAIGIVYLQFLAFSFSTFREISLFNYSAINPLIYGFLFGFGALTGDLIKSFFKRRLNIPQGKAWFPFDQIDYIVGTIIALSFVFHIPTTIIIWGLILSLVFHPIFNYSAYLLNLKETKR